MNNPVTYSFYKDVYCGNGITEADFPELSARALDYLEQVTFGRLDGELTDDQLIKVQKACCAVAEVEKLNREGGGKAAEAVGKYSVTYVAGISNTQTNAQRLRSTALRYLGNTGLMYRGV